MSIAIYITILFAATICIKFHTCFFTKVVIERNLFDCTIFEWHQVDAIPTSLDIRKIHSFREVQVFSILTTFWHFRHFALFYRQVAVCANTYIIFVNAFWQVVFDSFRDIEFIQHFVVEVSHIRSREYQRHICSSRDSNRFDSTHQQRTSRRHLKFHLNIFS